MITFDFGIDTRSDDPKHPTCFTGLDVSSFCVVPCLLLQQATSSLLSLTIWVGMTSVFDPGTSTRPPSMNWRTGVWCSSRTTSKTSAHPHEQLFSPADTPCIIPSWIGSHQPLLMACHSTRQQWHKNSNKLGMPPQWLGNGTVVSTNGK